MNFRNDSARLLLGFEVVLDLLRHFGEMRSEAVMGRGGIPASEFSPKPGTVRRLMGMRNQENRIHLWQVKETGISEWARGRQGRW